MQVSELREDAQRRDRRGTDKTKENVSGVLHRLMFEIQ